MPDTQQGFAENRTEQRLGRWECLVIKGFAILFLFLFLSEKAIREAGSIRRAWVTEMMEPLNKTSHGGRTCGSARAATGTICDKECCQKVRANRGVESSQ